MKVPAELRSVLPDETRVIESPSSRWVFDHVPAKIPVLQLLSINPTVSNVDAVKDNLAELLVGIENVNPSSSALLFRYPIAGEFAFSYSDKPIYNYFCFTHTESAPKQRWELQLPAYGKYRVSHIRYKEDSGFQKFDYRTLLLSRYYDDRLILDFGSPVSGTVVYRRDI